MKYSLSLFFLIGIAFQLWSQNSAKVPEQVTQPVYTNRWDLDKYVWSHTHHDATRPDKPIIDFDVIDNWPRLGPHLTVSRNGQYFAYNITRGTNFRNRSDTLVVQATIGTWRQAMIGAEPGFFSANSKWYIYQDQSGVCFMELGSGQRSYAKDVASFKTPVNTFNAANFTCQWIALHYINNKLILQNLVTGSERQFNEVRNYAFDVSGKWLICTKGSTQQELLLYDLKEDAEHRFPFPGSHLLSLDGESILMRYEHELVYADLRDGKSMPVWKQGKNDDKLGSYCFDKKGKQVAFVVKGGDSSAQNSIWYWKDGMTATNKIVDINTNGIDAGLFVNNTVSFSENDQYLAFSLRKPAPVYQAAKDAVPVTIWNYKDPLLQSVQYANPPKDKTLQSYFDLKNGKVVYVASEDESVDSRFPGDYLVISKGDNLQGIVNDRFWEKNDKRITTRVLDLRSGKSYTLPNGINQGNFSPSGLYLIYFDKVSGGNYFSLDLRNGTCSNISRGIPVGQLGQRDMASPILRQPETPYGFVFFKDNKSLVAYDNYDLWQLDYTGNKPPLNLTNGYGRSHNTVLRLAENIQSGRVYSDDDLLLKAFNLKTKYNGYFRTKLGNKGNPELLSMGPCFMQSIVGSTRIEGEGMVPVKAMDADVWIVKRHTNEEGENYCVTSNFKSYKMVTGLHPHKNINWYTKELHHFKCLDGMRREGVLYKPENFDPHKKYPVVIPFYEIYGADCIYVFQHPEYAWSPIAFITQPAWLVSHGYVVFVPRIYTEPLKVGFAIYNVMEGAARYLQQLPYVDAKHIGACSHSWSSNTVGYTFTHSKSISAIVMSEGQVLGNLINMALAPNAEGGSNLDMMENEFEFGNLWKNKKRWLDQTNVLNLDKVRMPVLLLCGNRGNSWIDEANRQAFQVFNSLRRLNKLAWWFQYQRGSHALLYLDEQKDFTIRMTQFLDHYLKGAPAPQWMTQGLSYKLRSVEAREELDPAGSCDLPDKIECPICKAWNKQYKRTPEMFSKPISEWKLDDDFKKQMDKEETEKYNKNNNNKNMKGEAQRIKDNNAKLKGISK